MSNQTVDGSYWLP